jgi:hypothetical protein
MSQPAVPLLPQDGNNEEARTRERSTIEFPYSDQNDAIVIAKAIYTLGGQVEWNTLAGRLNATPDGGGFRSRMSAARMFGVLSWEKDDVKLTDLGHRICDPQQEKAARVESFLLVALYAKVYDSFNGKMLPPVDGLESFMVNVGVAQKQKERARQAFQRSARQAGFFDFGTERLVKPPIARAMVSVPAPEPLPERPLPRHRADSERSFDPLIEGLLNRLPPPDSTWPTEARRRWLQAALNIFDVIYTTPDGENVVIIEVKQEGK